MPSWTGGVRRFEAGEQRGAVPVPCATAGPARRDPRRGGRRDPRHLLHDGHKMTGAVEFVRHELLRSVLVRGKNCPRETVSWAPQWALSRYWISIQKPTSILQSINQVSFKERSWLSSFPTKSCLSRPLQPLATARSVRGAWLGALQKAPPSVGTV